MGLETIALASLAVGAASTIAQTVQARKAARAQREAQAVSSASQQIQDRVARRRAVREARVRQAAIQQSAVASGGVGSSGAAGATSALQSNLGAGVANQRSQQLAAEGIGRQNVISANAQTRFDTIGSFGKLVQQGISLFDVASDTRRT